MGGGLNRAGGLLQNLTAKGGSLLERDGGLNRTFTVLAHSSIVISCKTMIGKVYLFVTGNSCTHVRSNRIHPIAVPTVA